MREGAEGDIAEEVSRLREQGVRPPGLATILVGDDPAFASYVRAKQRACEQSGITGLAHELPGRVDSDSLLEVIDALNDDERVDGILCQLPLPVTSPRSR